MIPRTINITSYLCLLLLVTVLYLFSEMEFNKSSIGWVLFIAALSYLMFFFRKESNPYISKQFLVPSKLFILGYTIVYFQNVLDVFFGYSDPYNELSILYPSAIIRSSLLSVMGLISFFIGYLLFDRKNSPTKAPQRAIATAETPAPQRQKFIPLNLLKIFCFALLALYLVFVNKAYLWGGYGTGVGMGGVASLVSYFLEGSIYGVLLLHSLNLKAQRQNISLSQNTSLRKTPEKTKLTLVRFIGSLGLFNLVIALYLLTVLLSGDRGAIIYITLGYFYCYLYCSSKIFSALKSLILIAIAGILISVLGVARTMRTIESKSEQIALAAEILSLREATSLSPPTKELANSLRCLHAVVEERERLGSEPYYGRFASYQILSSFPFSGTLLSLSGLYGSEHTSSAEYITELIQGRNPSYGDGTACIAELYLDFGPLGVIFAMVLFGLFMRKSDELSSGEREVSIFLFALVLLYFAHSIFIARSTLLFPLKKAIATFTICYLYIYFYKHFFSSKTDDKTRQ
ncbi:MAG: O-antigen polysaccharide polymerase Wzy [Rikenellaceae bacterium]